MGCSSCLLLPHARNGALTKHSGHWLRSYQEGHPHGSALDATLPEEEIETKQNRRRMDRAIWAGLGRDPEEGETPTIAVEFVSEGQGQPGA